MCINIIYLLHKSMHACRPWNSGLVPLVLDMQVRLNWSICLYSGNLLVFVTWLLPGFPVPYIAIANNSNYIDYN